MDVSVPRWYHCISRCVRQAVLLGEGDGDRREWLEGSVTCSQAAAGLEESLWLCPIEDRRRLDSNREGMMQGFPLGSYVNLVEYTGRLIRHGRA